METFVASDGTRLAYVVDDWTNPWAAPETLVLLHAAMGSSQRLLVYERLPHNITDAVPDRCAKDLRRFLLERAVDRQEGAR